MTLSNLEVGGGLALAAIGQTKSVTMLTDASAVPYSAYYDMPDGSVDWLSVVTTANVFSISAENNLFNSSSRSVVLRFFCLPTVSGTLQTQSVTVTQAADGVELTFDPVEVSLAYTEAATDTVEVSGIPSGSPVLVESSPWISAEMLDADTLSITASANESTSARVGAVTLTVDSRPFAIAVTQAANTLAVTFEHASLTFGHNDDLEQTETVTGIPSGASVEVFAPEWLSASYADDTLTLVALPNATGNVLSGSVEVVVYGLSFYLPVSQGANPYPDGKLTLSASSYTFSAFGGSLTVTATEMPPGVSLLTYSSPPQGTCVACGDTGAFVSITRLTDMSFSIAVEPQDIFNAVERVFLVDFSAGGLTARFTITQAVPSVPLYRLGGMGDKFLRSVSSLQEPSYLVESTSLFLTEQLKRAGWMALDTQRSPLLVGAERDEVPSIMNSLEAYKACHTHVQTGGTTYHKLAMGAMAYRFTFTAASYGIVLRGLRFSVRTDAYCAAGLRVALAVVTDGEDEPTADWATIREGTDGNVLDGFAARELRPDGKYYGKSSQAIFDGLDLEIGVNTRLYIYVTMEDYPGTLNGWVYGSGIVAPLFDFYTEDLTATAGELEVDDWIAEAGTTERSGLIAISDDGEVSSPEVPAQEVCVSREILYRDLQIGRRSDAPSDEVAFAAIPALFAKVASDGMLAVDMGEVPFRPWLPGQSGMCAYVARHVGGTDSPFANKLRYVVSPLAVLTSLPIGSAATSLRLTNRAGSGAVSSAGADVRLSVYWFSAQALELSEIAQLATKAAFTSGGSPLEVGALKGEHRGTIDMPTSMSEGATLAIPLGSLSERWGTLIIVPWIARVTAATLPAGGTAGLVGPLIDEEGVVGIGWVPKIEMEV